MVYRTCRREWDLSRQVLVMGIVNVTPDSFSEKGKTAEADAAIAQGVAMAAAGAAIVDVGGESTRPGAEPVSEAEELARVIPVIEGIRAESDVSISVDTYKAAVAEAAIAAGADIVNDISGLRRDPRMAGVIASSGAGCVLMHMRGTPQTMQQLTDYTDLIGEMMAFFEETMRLATEAGIRNACICLDPGVGFSKTADQSLVLIRSLDVFGQWNRPVLLGPSRKSFIGKVLDIDDPAKRIWGTAGAVAAGVMNGARLVRVHDVPEMRHVVDVSRAILNAE